MLPKIDTPIFDIELPISKKVVKVRPFTVKEEKILLFAQQENADKTVIESVLQVCNNCVVNEEDVSKLATFELEYLFVKLRAISVNNIVSLNIIDDKKSTEEEKVYIKTEINLDDITIQTNESKKINNKIKLDDTYQIKLRFPAYAQLDKIDLVPNENKKAGDIAVSLVSSVVESVFNEDGTEVYILDDYSQDEKDEFLSSLTSKNFSQIQEFLSLQPTLYLKFEYENEDGDKFGRELRGLADFFMLA